METKISILQEQMKEVCDKIDKLDKKIDEGFSKITNNYVRVDIYQRDLKAIDKQSRENEKSTACLQKNMNRLVWLIASTILGFIVMQIITYVK